jgi:hypothetical protein
MNTQPDIELPPRQGGSTIVVQEEALTAPTTTSDTASDTTAFLQMIERAARDPAVDLDKMVRLIALRDQMEQRAAKRLYDEAMSRAQTDMRRVATDSNNSQTRSKYASYAALDRAIRPIYVKHGFAATFDTGECPTEQCVRVLCEVSHTSGFSRQYHLDIPADGKGAKGGDVMTKTHAVGSAISYGRRYLLLMIFNIAIGTDDDDGNAASGPPTIGDEEAENLNKLITEAKANLAQFLKYFAIETVAGLPKKRLSEAKALLNRKKAEKPKSGGK